MSSDGSGDGQSDGQGNGIDAFWAWWPGGQERIRAAIEARKFEDTLVAEITAKVQGIHPKVLWEMGPGTTAQHAFCLSAGGDPELRRLTERWLRAAPGDAGANGVWEFHPAKRGAPALSEAKLQIADHTVGLADMRFTVTVDP